MAPSLATTPYAVHDTGVNATALTTTSFTPAVAEVLVAKLTTWDTAVNFGAGPAGGGLTWQKRIEAAPGGFAAYAAIWTATVGGSPSSMTVTATPSGNCRHALVLERWTNSQLAATPAVNSTVFGNATTPSIGLTTAAADSIVSWCLSDANSQDPTTRAYLSSATEEDVYDLHVSADGVWYYAYQAAVTLGAQTFGLSTPNTNLIWSAAGIEIQSTGGGAAPLPARPFVSRAAVVQAGSW